jgi:hypothetical protein
LLGAPCVRNGQGKPRKASRVSAGRPIPRPCAFYSPASTRSTISSTMIWTAPGRPQLGQGGIAESSGSASPSPTMDVTRWSGQGASARPKLASRARSRLRRVIGSLHDNAVHALHDAMDDFQGVPRPAASRARRDLRFVGLGVNPAVSSPCHDGRNPMVRARRVRQADPPFKASKSVADGQGSCSIVSARSNSPTRR